jgi:hypothetical protein
VVVFKWFRRRKPSLCLDSGSAVSAQSNAQVTPRGTNTLSGGTISSTVGSGTIGDGKFGRTGTIGGRTISGSTVGGHGKANHTDPLLAELAALGENSGFLSSSGRQRTQEIGAQLNRRGGQRKMLSAHRAITAQLGREAVRELEVTWNGIGSWAG